MTESDRPTVGVYTRIIIRHAKLAQTRQPLRSKGLVQLDDIHLIQRQPGARERQPRGRHGPHPHDARLYPGRRTRHDARERSQSMLRRCASRCDQQRGRPIVQATGVTGRHGALPVVPERRLQRGQRVQGGVGPQEFIL